MRGLCRSALFHKKSRGSPQGRKDSQDEQALHSRKWSTSSTASQVSSTSTHERLGGYDPLSLHPPLSLNTSPHIIPEYDPARYQEDEEQEARFFNQARHAPGDPLQDTAEYSPVKSHDCYFARPNSGRPYVYDQSVQWPLKDWQTIPPGLAELDSPTSSASSPPESPSAPTNPRRRRTEWMNESDVFLKRGEWKRRGIVFHLDSEEEEEQEHHFELPE
ncbi:hypothetical protein AAE478_008262 [Parahypoxylon ruwenzoriense]